MSSSTLATGSFLLCPANRMKNATRCFFVFFSRLQGFKKKKKYCIFSGDLAAVDGRGLCAQVSSL